MKYKMIILSALAVFVTAPVFAAGNYGASGCGLGSIVMGSTGNQILAATTSAITYTQFFGITSGTSNCAGGGGSKASNDVPMFVETNKQALATDIARGSGESVANLSEVLGCESPARLSTALQKNFKSIFPNPTIAASQVTENIIGVVKKDNRLATDCYNAI